ncbi:hypothetical protein, partial [Staphylococcus felis]|uniref:hypothetical protein n=1 Tax=Staphylococcus felis TaxID=46127 RepID=UPI000E374524
LELAPKARTVKPVTDSTEVRRGTGRAERTVSLAASDGKKRKGTVDEGGRYEVKVPDTVDLKSG